MSHDDLGALSRRRFLSLAGAGAAAIALAACGSDDEGSSSSQTTAAGQGASLAGTTITTAVYSKNHASSPLFWQRFAPEGLTVKVIIFTNPTDMNRALQAGDLDFALMGPYNTLIEKEQQGLGSKVICMCSQKGIGLVARDDRGIDSVADLKGKRFGYPPAGIHRLILPNLLKPAGLTVGDMVLRQTAFADQPGALERGDVDAYFGTEPLVTQSVLSGVGKRLVDPYTTSLGDFNTAIWASPKMLARPDVLKAATKMQRDAAEYLSPGGKNDPAVWKDLLVTQFGYTEPVYQEVLSNIGAVWRFDEARKKQFEGAAKEMRATGDLKKDVDFSQVFELQHQPQS
jgi:NitT/TauT family transport system substrate-binding protein